MTTSRRKPWLVRALATAVAAAVVYGGRARASEPQPLRYDVRVDLPITLFAGATFVLSEELKENLAPIRCRICASTDGLNGLDRWVQNHWTWDDRDRAAHISDWIVFGFAPLVAAGGATAVAAANGRIDQAPLDIMLIAEASLLGVSFVQLLKYTVGRERPFLAALPPEERAKATYPVDANLSFASGHTALPFALAASTITVTALRRYDGAPVLWAIGIGLAAAGGYLRIAAERHYVTDVLAGMVVGAGFGVLVPVFGHPRIAKNVGPIAEVRIMPVPERAGLGFALVGSM